MATPKVGGEVDAFCTKCKMSLAHTILAMVGTKIARVRCNTCNGDHVYRTEAGSARVGAASSTTKRAAPRERAEKVTITFEQQLAGKDLSAAKPYSARTTYAVEDVFSHPTFGYGLVSAVRGDKVDVVFKATEKTLVHGRGDGPAAPKPAFAAPAAPSSGPADKPTTDAQGSHE